MSTEEVRLDISECEKTGGSEQEAGERLRGL